MSNKCLNSRDLLSQAMSEKHGTTKEGNTSNRETCRSSCRTPDLVTPMAQGLTICICASKVISSLVMSLLIVLLTPFSSYFLNTCCLTDATDWNQINPLCNSTRWTVWPSGRSDPKHRL